MSQPRGSRQERALNLWETLFKFMRTYEISRVWGMFLRGQAVGCSSDVSKPLDIEKLLSAVQYELAH